MIIDTLRQQPLYISAASLAGFGVASVMEKSFQKKSDMLHSKLGVKIGRIDTSKLKNLKNAKSTYAYFEKLCQNPILPVQIRDHFIDHDAIVRKNGYGVDFSMGFATQTLRKEARTAPVAHFMPMVETYAKSTSSFPTEKALTRAAKTLARRYDVATLGSLATRIKAVKIAASAGMGIGIFAYFVKSVRGDYVNNASAKTNALT